MLDVERLSFVCIITFRRSETSIKATETEGSENWTLATPSRNPDDLKPDSEWRFWYAAPGIAFRIWNKNVFDKNYSDALNSNVFFDIAWFWRRSWLALALQLHRFPILVKKNIVLIFSRTVDLLNIRFYVETYFKSENILVRWTVRGRCLNLICNVHVFICELVQSFAGVSDKRNIFVENWFVYWIDFIAKCCDSLLPKHLLPILPRIIEVKK